MKSTACSIRMPNKNAGRVSCRSATSIRTRRQPACAVRTWPRLDSRSGCSAPGPVTASSRRCPSPLPTVRRVVEEAGKAPPDRQPWSSRSLVAGSGLPSCRGATPPRPFSGQSFALLVTSGESTRRGASGVRRHALLGDGRLVQPRVTGEESRTFGPAAQAKPVARTGGIFESRTRKNGRTFGGVPPSIRNRGCRERAATSGRLRPATRWETLSSRARESRPRCRCQRHSRAAGRRRSGRPVPACPAARNGPTALRLRCAARCHSRRRAHGRSIRGASTRSRLPRASAARAGTCWRGPRG